MRVKRTDEYRDWIDALRDLDGRAHNLVRVDRLIHGNPEDHRHLGEGVSELRIDVGPGCRVYDSLHRERLLLLLAGGDKSPQASDIALAIQVNREIGD